MTSIHEPYGITARPRRVSISIFGILILVTLVSCETTVIGTPTAPAGLTDLSVRVTTADSVELIWGQPIDFGTTDGTIAALFGSYAVKVYEGADDSGSEVDGLTLEPAALGKSTVSVRVSGLSSETQYAFKLVLSNSNDPPMFSDSNVVSVTTTEKGVPTAAAGLKDLAVKETSTTADSVELTWSKPTDFGTTDGTTAAIFGSYAVKVYQGADESGSEVEGLTLTPSSLDENTTSVKVSGLNHLTQYAFKLVLSNGNDSPLSSDSNVVSETTKEPTAPAGLKDLAVKEASTTADTVELTWSRPTDFGTTDGTTAAIFGSYVVKVYQGADESGSEVEGLTLEPSSLDESTVSVKVSGLSSDTQYAFKLVLSNSNDPPLSSDSNVVSATPQDPTGRIWNKVSVNDDWFSARQDPAMVAFDNKLWVIGGHYGGTRYDDVWSSSDGESWTEVPKDVKTTRFPARTSHAVVVFNNKLWVIGGDGATLFNDVWSSPDGKSWTEETEVTEETEGVTPPPRFSARKYHSVVVFNNKLWVIGGYDGGLNYFNDIWSSSDGKNWTEETEETEGVTTPPRFSARYSHSTVVFDNKLWVIGGFDGVYLNDVWSSPDGKNWTEETEGVTTPRFFTRYRSAVVVLDGKIWIVGGLDFSNKRHNDVWSSPDGKSWTEVTKDVTTPRFSKRYSHAAAVFNNKLWVIAGNTATSDENDVWSSP